MNYLNGIPEKQESAGEVKADFWDQINVSEKDKNRIEKKITSMRNKYEKYREKNALLSIIAQMKTLLKNKEDEINRL